MSWLRPRWDIRAALELNTDRVQLIASLAFNFIAKVPGVVAVFIVLPMISQSLGTAAYGELLSALAIGSVFTLPFGGITAVGRRLLASAVGARECARQATVCANTTLLMGAVATGATITMVAVSHDSWTRPVFIAVSMLPLLAGLFNVFDTMRASFNEHYVTSVFQLVLQIAVYSGVYFFGLPKGNVAMGGLVLQAPFLLASLMTGITLLAQRPYLLTGRIDGVRAMLLPAFGVIMADGALSILLNGSVYWLNAEGSPEMAAWVGTFTRLFQSFMSPLLLILFPVTTYISIRWQRMTKARQLVLHKLFILMGFVYGIIVGGAMALAGPWYIGHMFRLSVSGDRIDVAAISLFIGAVVAQKAYTMLLYAVAEARLISFGTAFISLSGVAIAWLSSRHGVSPMRAIDTLFFFVSAALPLLLAFSGIRYQRAYRNPSVSQVG